MSRKKTAGGKKETTGKQGFRDAIVKILGESYPRPLNYKQVSSRLNIRDQKLREKISSILVKLRNEGLAEETGAGRFRMPNAKPVITGTIDIARDGEATLLSEEIAEPVLIPPRMLRNAMAGDTVRAYIFTNKRTGRVEGEVIEVMKRARTEYVGTVQVARQFAFLVPDSRKMGLDIFIPLASLNDAKHGEKVIGRITDWPEHAKNPVGEIIKVLGSPGNNNVEMHAIMAEFGLPYEFPTAVLAAADHIPATIPPGAFKDRKDLRDVLTFTIDPADAKDFDDALSIRPVGENRWEVGVHIADVSWYVREGDAIDQEALSRGTSVYLVDRVVPMLPEVLSNHVCSLRPGEDKLCFSAIFIMDEDGQVHEEWYGRTLIHSDRRFTYEEAQQIIETGKGDHAREILLLNSIAHKLRGERMKKGAIDFHSTEVKFRLDQNGEPIGVFIKEQKDAHRLIEDFMLLANRKVAETAGKVLKKAFVYRVHDAPEKEKLQKFGNFVKKLGLKFQLKEKKSASEAINRLLHSVEGRREESIVEQMAIRTMAKAAYSTKNIGHYGLGFDYYSHFTSPIRRYPDLMVHRLLQAFLQGEKPRPGGLEDICKFNSERERVAADAERSSIKFMQVKYLQDKIGETFEGVVSGMNEWGLYVEIDDNKCEGMIRLRDLNDDFYTYDEENFYIVGRRHGRKFRLGDKLRIEVKRADLTKKQIDFLLAE